MFKVFKDNVRGVLMAGCCAAVVVCGGVSGIVISDGTEDHPESKMLSDYHITIMGKNGCFLPKNSNDVAFFYDRYKLRECPTLFFLVGDIGLELGTRLGNGDMYFIDKYIDHLKTFIDLMVKHPDRDFTVGLFAELALPHTLGECGVQYAWGVATVWKTHPLKKHEALYVAFRLNDLFNDTGLYGTDALLNSYFLHHNEFPDEIKEMFSAVREMYTSRGLSLPNRLSN
jgi:hypothetical protein